MKSDIIEFSKLRAVRMEYHDGPVEDLISHFERHDLCLTRRDHDGATLWLVRLAQRNDG